MALAHVSPWGGKTWHLPRVVRRTSGLITALGGRRLWTALAVLTACAAAFPAPGRALPAKPLTAQVTETTDGGSMRLAALPDAPFSDPPPNGIPIIDVDGGATFQTVNGFGAALTDSSAWLIHDQLPATRRATLLENLFGAGGLDLRFLRLPMGASDFTVHGRPYTYDDLPRGRKDPRLKHFSIRHDRAYIIPTVRGALAIDPNLDILATPWSPPPWMKANDAFDNVAGRGTLLRSAYRPLAQYFVKFIRAYAAAGINISAVTPQNEPQGTSLFPGLNMPWRTEARWITRYLVPALRAAGLATKIYAADVGWSTPRFQDALVRTPAVRALEGVAWHCYGGSPAVMEGLHALAPALDQLVTECAIQITPYTVPEVVIRSLLNGASTVALWNLALNPSGGPVQPPNSGCHGCRGLVTVDERTHTLWYGLTYYQLGQFSRFISEGAVRIGSTQVPGLDDVAVRNPDGTVALIVYNHSHRAIRFGVGWEGQCLSYALAPAATATFVWNPATGA